MCASRFKVIRAGEFKGGKLWNEDVYVPCGRCAECKMNRVRQWVFRLLEEDKVSTSSHFVTLTYDSRFVPLTPSGRMTLDKKDLFKFFKTLRKKTDANLKYYLAAEYGSKRMRPHYHFILFNWDRDLQVIADTWYKGSVHFGDVKGASVAYTAKYIDKGKQVPQYKGDDRLPEFSLMSKKLGESYMTEAVKNYHAADLERNYVLSEQGHKIPLPRYYAKKMFNDEELDKRAALARFIVEQNDIERERLYNQTDMSKQLSYAAYRDYLQQAKEDQLKKSTEKRNKL